MLCPMNMSQTTLRISLFVFLCFTLFSCSNDELEDTIVIENISSSRGIKTTISYTQIFRIALEKALSDERLPLKKELIKNHFIKDSILLCIDMPIGSEAFELPKVGDLNFKLLAKEELCRMLIKKGDQVTPPYIYVHSINSSEDAIQLKVDNTCISVVNINSNTDACDYLSHCGGGMEIRCEKHGQIWKGDVIDTWLR